MVAKLIDSELYVDNGDGSYSEVKWCDLQSATLECECNEDYYREKLKRLLLGENHYREKPRIDIPSKKNISDQIYRLLSFHNQNLSEFNVSVMARKNPIDNSLKLTILLRNYVYQVQSEVSMIFFDGTTQKEIQAEIDTALGALVMKNLADIEIRNKIYFKKENDIMAQYTCEKTYEEVFKTQEEIELQEKLAKLRAEYDKKAVKLREEFKAAQAKRLNDEHSKEIHDKYQSLIDTGFTEEKAWEILKTMLGEFEL